MKVFTYGTLMHPMRMGMHAGKLPDESYADRLERHVRHDVDSAWFPGVIAGDGKVDGVTHVYNVDKETEDRILHRLDAYEGTPFMYRRQRDGGRSFYVWTGGAGTLKKEESFRWQAERDQMVDDGVVKPCRRTECYCNEDQGAGYTFEDEHGPCDVCLGKQKEVEV